MHRTILLAALLLLATAPALAPTAAANACASNDPVDDVECEAARAEKSATCTVNRLPDGVCPIPL